MNNHITTFFPTDPEKKQHCQDALPSQSALSPAELGPRSPSLSRQPKRMASWRNLHFMQINLRRQTLLQVIYLDNILRVHILFLRFPQASPLVSFHLSSRTMLHDNICLSVSARFNAYCSCCVNGCWVLVGGGERARVRERGCTRDARVLIMTARSKHDNFLRFWLYR